MRVFLDTNVLVAAFATRGLCADVLRAVLTDHDLLIGEVVLAELRDVLPRKLGLPIATVHEIVSFLRRHTVIARPARHEAAGLRHVQDEWILASAVAGHADVLVTGDEELLGLRKACGIPIVNPRGLWEMLRRDH